MHVLTPPARLIALLLAIVLAASACSSGSDDAATDAGAATTAPADTESSDAEPEEGEAPAVSCEAAGEAGATLRGANGWMPQVVDAESNDVAGSTDNGASVLAAIEVLRPAQDIEGPLGSMREGLDNMEADIIAINEGRFGDIVGGYSVARVSAVIGEEIC